MIDYKHCSYRVRYLFLSRARAVLLNTSTQSIDSTLGILNEGCTACNNGVGSGLGSSIDSCRASISF